MNTPRYSLPVEGVSHVHRGHVVVHVGSHVLCTASSMNTFLSTGGSYRNERHILHRSFAPVRRIPSCTPCGPPTRIPPLSPHFCLRRVALAHREWPSTSRISSISSHATVLPVYGARKAVVGAHKVNRFFPLMFGHGEMVDVDRVAAGRIFAAG
jgi:hypothetical protein